MGGAAGRRTAAPPPVGGDLGAGEGGAGPSPRPAHGARLELLTINRQSYTITKNAPTRAFSWLKAATTAFTFKTLLRHYAKQALTPRSLNVKLGPRRKGHKGRAGWLA